MSQHASYGAGPTTLTTRASAPSGGGKDGATAVGVRSRLAYSWMDSTTPQTRDPLGICAPPLSAAAWTSESRSEMGTGENAPRPRPERGVPAGDFGGPRMAAEKISPTARSFRRSGGFATSPEAMASKGTDCWSEEGRCTGQNWTQCTAWVVFTSRERQ
eukprot:scaffold194248_cov27-Tisochrysis_lutea.AAC.1